MQLHFITILTILLWVDREVLILYDSLGLLTYAVVHSHYFI